VGAHRSGRDPAEGRRVARLSGARVCRVRPDVAAVERELDYLVPDELADQVEVGAVVRVLLHGRRVRGWVVADKVEPEAGADRLKPLLAVVSSGPPAEVVELCRFAAWRFAGPFSAMLRAASPPNVVRPGAVDEPEAAVFPDAALPGLSDVLERDVGLLEWPPSADRRDLVLGLLARSGSTIVVVPEGARLGSLVGHLERVGRRVVVMRGDQLDAVRATSWSEARRGGCTVVGGRVAVLAPVPDLAAIVVLDEGDEALKEERAPTWHARELALERAGRVGVRVTLVSPAPSVDALAIAGTMIRPDRATERRGWPSLQVVDRREERPDLGLLTEPLARRLHDVLGSGRRAVCMVNRKGRARLLACVSCGELVRCEACGAAVAEHEHGLACPRCETLRPPVCLRCGGSRLRVVRAGVSRLRDDLAALLPRATVAEVDASTKELPDADVLVGTEAVLHRVRRAGARPVGLVAYLEFDQELLALRYRASEQALWLLVRGSRAAGPDGWLLVQTRLPDHEVLRAVMARDPSIALDPEVERRRATGFPPFGGLAELTGAMDAVSATAAALTARGVTVLGPSPWRSGGRALARSDDVAALCDALAVAAPEGRRHGRLRVEVDPMRV
jgi:primosomal protein N' (replication factor Y)